MSGDDNSSKGVGNFATCSKEPLTVQNLSQLDKDSPRKFEHLHLKKYIDSVIAERIEAPLSQLRSSSSQILCASESIASMSNKVNLITHLTERHQGSGETKNTDEEISSLAADISAKVVSSNMPVDPLDLSCFVHRPAASNSDLKLRGPARKSKRRNPKECSPSTGSEDDSEQESAYKKKERSATSGRSSDSKQTLRVKDYRKRKPQEARCTNEDDNSDSDGDLCVEIGSGSKKQKWKVGVRAKDQHFVGHIYGLKDEEQPYLVSKSCLNGVICGTLIINPKRKKEAARLLNSPQLYRILSGKIRVNVENNVVVLRNGDVFTIYIGEVFTIENLSDVPARIFFVEIEQDNGESGDDESFTSELSSDEEEESDVSFSSPSDTLSQNTEVVYPNTDDVRSVLGHSFR